MRKELGRLFADENCKVIKSYLKVLIFILLLLLEIGLSKKHTKFKRNLPHGFDKSADLLSKHQNHEEDFFFKLCVLLIKSELYRRAWSFC